MKTWPLIFVAPLLGLLIGGWIHPWLAPLLTAAIYFPHFYTLLSRGMRLRVLGHTLLWALSCTLTVALATYFLPVWTASAIVSGLSYRAEMFQWLQTGLGAEGNWRLFLPRHAAGLLAFSAACLLSGGLLGLVLGSTLLNAMAFYVGHLLLAAHAHGASVLRLPAVFILGYSPWAATRVTGYILLAITLSEAFYRKVMPLHVWYPRNAWYGKAGLILVGVDVLMKAWLAGFWRRFLMDLIGISQK